MIITINLEFLVTAPGPGGPAPGKRVKEKIMDHYKIRKMEEWFIRACCGLIGIAFGYLWAGMAFGVWG